MEERYKEILEKQLELLFEESEKALVEDLPQLTRSMIDIVILLNSIANDNTK